jgi:hypothetical protein
MAWHTDLNCVASWHARAAVESMAETQMVEPPWNMVAKQQGFACVDASQDHDPFTENNTRCATFCSRSNNVARA